MSPVPLLLIEGADSAPIFKSVAAFHSRKGQHPVYTMTNETGGITVADRTGI